MKENKKIEIGISLLCLLLLLPLFLIAIYNRPSADDYSYAILTHEVVEAGGGLIQLIKAAWQTDINFYKTWQGLYSSAFILSLHPGIWGESLYGLTTFIVVGIAYICLLLSFHIFNKHFINKSFTFSIMASLVVITILLLWLPSPVEGLYWYNGAMNYMPWAFTNLLNLALLVEIIFSKSSKKKNALIIASTILAFLTSGANHVTAFSNILILTFASIFLLRKKRYYSLSPLISAIVGFIIMYLAPGTAIRQNALSKQTVFITLLATLNKLRTVLGQWICLNWFLSLIIVTPIAIYIARKYKDKLSNITTYIIIYAIASLMILGGMFCVPYYALGSFGAGRVINVIWITFMFLSWGFYILLWCFLEFNNYVNVSKIIKSKNIQTVLGLIYSTCLIALFIIPNYWMSSSSLKAVFELANNKASTYAAEMDERFNRYLDKSLDIVEVKPLKTKSELLFFDDLVSDPTIWPNTAMSKYYHKSMIYLVPENIPE